MEPDNLKKISAKERIPLGMVENDYVITFALGVISLLPYLRSDMIFKGGTAIKKVYYPEARFSVDLDFTCHDDVTEHLHSDLKKIFGLKKEKFGVDFSDVVVEERSEKGSRLRVKYNDISRHPNSFYIDLRIGEKPYLKADLLPLQDRYKIREKLFCGYAQKPTLTSYRCKLLEQRVSPSMCLKCDRFTPLEVGKEEVLPIIRVRTMSIEEILAEKIRAMISRGRPRDLYDIWYLTKEKRIKPNITLVNKKLQILDRNKEFSLDKLKQTMEEAEAEWQRDLSELLPTVPSFKTIQEHITATF